MLLSQQLKRTILDSGESFNSISRATRVAVPVISRFANGERSLKIETADRLAAHFGLELRPVKPQRRRKER